ncbi:hypothetical protein UFOVP115_107 [uncultured Caudovirales phage]|uniref:Uncharacterized protein n=1 Tax=uncultured Caudovirales phage TaxID=2100421 RepID=A0A6J5L9M8_9CAUD|nr:hypothetical protein UFOVP115_107 [uncultured Caudovirales phage]
MSTSIHLNHTDNGVKIFTNSHTDELDELWGTIKIVPKDAEGFGIWDHSFTLYLDEKAIRALRKQLKLRVAEFDAARNGETAE